MQYHFIGIAGSGMSALAQLVRSEGHGVRGSDRNFDQGGQTDLRAALASLGITIVAQNGSGVNAETHQVVLSAAVEDNNPDLIQAKMLGIPCIGRAKLLASLFDKHFGIAVAGTSGKSTVTAMIATILRELGDSPTYYGGAALLGKTDQPFLANVLVGSGKTFCAETDESDGSLLEFHPKIGVLTNISKDHKSRKELIKLFTRFLEQTEKILVLNDDCPATRKLALPPRKRVWYGTDEKKFPLSIRSSSMEGTRIVWKGIPCLVRPAGMHNVSNALAALSAVECLGHSIENAAAALEAFRGVHRRLEHVGTVRGIAIFDDFAHNPAKIEATLATLRNHFARIFTVFQLHGFGPARFMRHDLEKLFAKNLRAGDQLLLPDIYDAGGTANRSLGAKEIVEGIQKKRPAGQVRYLPDKEEIVEYLAKRAKPQDAVVIMGARDPELPKLGARLREVLTSL